jgi:restriction system protein
MARRRGLLAELHYQNQQAEKRRRQQAAGAYRAQAAALREAERTRHAAQRARQVAVVANVHERARLEKEAARLHDESQVAEVKARNASLTQTFEDIDGILAATLDVDNYVDLERLKVTAQHPPFDPGPHGVPTKPMPELVYPPQPTYVEPPAPGGLFGAKKKHAELIAQAQAAYQQALAHWNANNTALYNAHVAETQRRVEAERKRLEHLAALKAQYKLECGQREAEAAARNEELTNLINDLAFDVESAIHEYVGIVLSNAVYPDAFPVEHDHTFDLATRELTLSVTVPPPSAVPSTKEYRYVKAKDEIVEATLSLKAQKDRYASAVAQVAVRTLHEIFEADRGGKIHSIALTVGTDTIAPATGLPTTIPLVIAAADRETFGQFDLANVVPKATLEHLGAAVSKSSFDLTPADTSRGVRVRKQ